MQRRIKPSSVKIRSPAGGRIPEPPIYDILGAIIIEFVNKTRVVNLTTVENQRVTVISPTPPIWVIENQFGRRNLNSAQRCKLVLEKKAIVAKKAKERQGERTDLYQNSDKSSPPLHTLPELAKTAGVSPDTLWRTVWEREGLSEFR